LDRFEFHAIQQLNYRTIDESGTFCLLALVGKAYRLIVSSCLWPPISATKDMVLESEKARNKIREPEPAAESVLGRLRMRSWLRARELIMSFTMADRFA
jgi:hypothetical protein